ncbi:hypothetical protein MTR_8g094020 [Medicago truncatula]|uniref:Uncharacterized protein n=1 Tax=Medicago truncatula TaxID=3880 RepID=G7LE55_MEDTR|nr:hypothetical protein MTR_8g094020 [Medicago truncatula]
MPWGCPVPLSGLHIPRSDPDDNGAERAIYYLSRVLNDAEIRYSPIKSFQKCSFSP